MTASNSSSKSYKFHRPLESFQMLTNELHREHCKLLSLEEQLIDCQVKITEMANFIQKLKKHWEAQKNG